jgi:hypothetical protein
MLLGWVLYWACLVLAALPLLISILALLYENVLDAIEYGLPALVLYRIGRAIRYVLAAELSNGESGPAGSRRRSPRAFFALAGHGESRQGNGGLEARAFPRYAARSMTCWSSLSERSPRPVGNGSGCGLVEPPFR